jgi:hypothetical protein
MRFDDTRLESSDTRSAMKAQNNTSEYRSEYSVGFSLRAVALL